MYRAITACRVCDAATLNPSFEGGERRLTRLVRRVPPHHLE